MKQLLIIGYIWPEPKSTGAGVRMLQLINYFLKQGYKITFASAASKSLHSESLQAIGVQEEDIQLNSSSFDFFIKQFFNNFVIRFYQKEMRPDCALLYSNQTDSVNQLKSVWLHTKKGISATYVSFYF